MEYNGWTNYATWRVNLEIIDGLEIETKMSAEDMKEFVEDVVFNHYNGTGNRLMYDSIDWQLSDFDQNGDDYNSIHSEVMRLAIEKMYLQT